MEHGQEIFTDQIELETKYCKQCSSCKLVYALNFFYLKTRGLYGVDSKCKQCVLLSKHKKYQKNKRRKQGMIELIDDKSEFLIPCSIHLMARYLGIK